MAQNKIVRFGPVALTTTLTTNLLNPPTTTGGTNCGTPATYIVLRHIRIVNKTGSPATVSVWLGGTGANAVGTEVIAQGTSVAANSYIDWYGQLRLDSTDFLVGGSGTATALSFQGEGEISLA